ncbi:hypothetical protein DMN91_002302 [Ooceraea biroi]|uniref:Uncharacterized protein n=1 Tax=Ooceraea biroi TaxID=2015173 RepID=A0A3L8E0I3_OOCBI|nr:hypothetical protein DMN91_002302 [Ooceraea biroi]
MCCYCIFILLCYPSCKIQTAYQSYSGTTMFPIFGDVANVYDRSGEDLWDLRDLRFQKHRPIYKLWSLTIANVVLSHPDDIQKLPWAFHCGTWKQLNNSSTARQFMT